MKNIIILLFLISRYTSYSQGTVFDFQYNSTPAIENRIEIVSKENDSIVYFITLVDTINFLTKYNLNNNTILWNKFLWGRSSWITNMLISKNGIYVAYNSNNNQGLARFSSSGNIIWNKKYYAGGSNVGGGMANADSSNGIALCFGGCIAANLVLRIDSIGNILWQHSYPNLTVGWNGGDAFNIINKTGKYVLFGRYVDNKNHGHLTYFEITKDGSTVLKAKNFYFQNDSSGYLRKIVQTNEGDYIILLDEFGSDNTTITTLDSSGNHLKSLYVICDSFIVSNIEILGDKKLLCLGYAPDQLTGGIGILDLTNGALTGKKNLLQTNNFSTTFAFFGAGIITNNKVLLTGNILPFYAKTLFFKTDTLFSNFCSGTYFQLQVNPTNGIDSNMVLYAFNGNMATIPLSDPTYFESANAIPLMCVPNNIELQKTNALYISPNPVLNGQDFTIYLGEIKSEVIVEILSGLGQILYSGSFLDTEKVKIQINSDFKTGIYFIKINDRHDVSTRKIIIGN